MMKCLLPGAEFGAGQRIALRVRLRSLQHRFAQRFLLWRQADRSTAISAIYARLWILDIIEVFVTVPAAAYFSTFRHIVVGVSVLANGRQFARWIVVANRLQGLLKES